MYERQILTTEWQKHISQHSPVGHKNVRNAGVHTQSTKKNYSIWCEKGVRKYCITGYGRDNREPDIWHRSVANCHTGCWIRNDSSNKRWTCDGITCDGSTCDAKSSALLKCLLACGLVCVQKRFLFYFFFFYFAVGSYSTGCWLSFRPQLFQFRKLLIYNCIGIMQNLTSWRQTILKSPTVRCLIEFMTCIYPCMNLRLNDMENMLWIIMIFYRFIDCW